MTAFLVTGLLRVPLTDPLGSDRFKGAHLTSVLCLKVAMVRSGGIAVWILHVLTRILPCLRHRNSHSALDYRVLRILLRLVPLPTVRRKLINVPQVITGGIVLYSGVFSLIIPNARTVCS